jgi:hypothetical protein
MGEKVEALADIRHAIELNPNDKKQIQVNKNFESLLGDPDFRAIVDPH